MALDTEKLDLPYPELVDAANIPLRMQNLAERLDKLMGDMRSHDGLLQEGVFGSGDFKVTNPAGRDLLAATGRMLIADDTGIAGPVGRLVDVVRANANVVTMDAADADPRLDQVFSVIPAGGASREPTIQLVKGTPTPGCTLDGRQGAGAIPSNADLIADAHMSSGGVITLRDRRKWARGAHKTIVRNANGGGTDDYSTTTSSFVNIDGTNLVPRLELTGNPVRAEIFCRAITDNVSGATSRFQLLDNDVAPDGGAQSSSLDIGATGGKQEPGPVYSWVWTPSAGSHLLIPQWNTSAGTLSLYARATIPMKLVITETIRQDASNN